MVYINLKKENEMTKAEYVFNKYGGEETETGKTMKAFENIFGNKVKTPAQPVRKSLLGAGRSIFVTGLINNKQINSIK